MMITSQHYFFFLVYSKVSNFLNVYFWLMDLQTYHVLPTCLQKFFWFSAEGFPKMPLVMSIEA